MEQKTVKVFFALLRSVVCGVMLTEEELELHSSVQWQDLLKIATKHDMQHLLAYGLKLNNLITKENENLEQHIFTAAFRCESLQHELDILCSALEKAQIPFIPLKGSVLRKHYPEPWMRTSCDIDILVHDEDIPKAVEYLTEQLNYTNKGRGSHDVSLYSPGGVHIELHFDLVEEERATNVSDVLNSVWQNITLHKNSKYWYEMTDAFLYFYHIVHMAKHIETGGCGARSFIDLWILDNMEDAEQEKRIELLEKGKFLKFAQEARKLSKIWVENEDHDPISLQMENYILSGGIYGNMENRVIVQQQKKGGRFKYAMSKIFIPYDVIKFHYPVLQKHRWLTPFMELRRWCKLIFCGHLKRTTRELRYNSGVSNAEAVNIQKFLNDIGLK